MNKPIISGPELVPKQKRNRGKRKNRSEIKELLMLFILNKEGNIGRYRLKDIMGLSEHEGLVRQMLSDLQKQGYAASSRSGCTLTQKGKNLLENNLRAYNIIEIKPFDFPFLKTGKISTGLHLQNRANKIESVMKIRDIAVRGGATGATIIIYKADKISIPSVYKDLISEHPGLAKKVLESFSLENEDVIVVISADDDFISYEASLTIAKALL